MILGKFFRCQTILRCQCGIKVTLQIAYDPNVYQMPHMVLCQFIHCLTILQSSVVSRSLYRLHMIPTFTQCIIRYYEGCSNMNASGFITFFTYMLRQNGKRFYKGLYVTFKLAPDLKTNTIYLSSYSPWNKGLVSILTNLML